LTDVALLKIFNEATIKDLTTAKAL